MQKVPTPRDLDNREKRCDVGINVEIDPLCWRKELFIYDQRQCDHSDRKEAPAMSNKELLEEISETAFDPGLKATAIRDRVRDILTEAGYSGDEDEVEEGEEG